MRTRLKAGSAPAPTATSSASYSIRRPSVRTALARRHVDLRQLAADELGAGRTRHVGEVVSLHVAAGERHADGHRAGR